MLGNRTRKWLTNLTLLRGCRFPDDDREVVYHPSDDGRFTGVLRLHLKSLRYDLVVLYEPPDRLTWTLCLLRALTVWRKPRFILINIVFTKPAPGLRGRVKQAVKRYLFKNVDMFISFMNHIPAIESLFGIPPSRHAFVPFKTNKFARQYADTQFPDGTYVFTGGRSRRDFDTFCAAMRGLGYPSVIVTPCPREAAYHETYFDDTAAPDNVRVVHDEGSCNSWLQWMAGSKLVVLCITDDAISPSGVSVYLQAMALGKCVIVTDCPSTRGILEDGNQAILVGQRDVPALAAATRRAWEDDGYRHGIAQRGRSYAASLGGEQELNQRFVDVIVRRFG
jgi:glycosyltransferase involved in cell wall biosynthesis